MTQTTDTLTFGYDNTNQLTRVTEGASRLTSIHLYRAGHRWVLRFDLESTADAEELKAFCVTQCSRSEDEPLTISPSDSRVFRGLTKIVCWRTRRPTSVPLSLNDSVTEWWLSADQWEQCGGLIDGLIEAGKGHQYLSEDERGEPVVVASLNEISRSAMT